MAANIVVLELGIALDAGEDLDTPLSLRQTVALKGRDELGREESLKTILELRQKLLPLLKVRNIMKDILWNDREKDHPLP